MRDAFFIVTIQRYRLVRKINEMERVCMILVILNSIYRLSSMASGFFKIAWCKTSHFFKLGRKMSYTAVAELKGDFTQVHFVIDNELFYFFDLLQNEKMFNGDPFNF